MGKDRTTYRIELVQFFCTHSHNPRAFNKRGVAITRGDFISTLGARVTSQTYRGRRWPHLEGSSVSDKLFLYTVFEPTFETLSPCDNTRSARDSSST